MAMGNPLQPPQPPPQVSGLAQLQPGQVERGPRAQPTSEPRQRPPLQAAENPPEEIDPEIGLKVAKESVEAVKTASDADKKAMNAELDGMLGKGSVDKAYTEALKRIGGEKTFDPKLSKQDKGLFLMDFGMRLMAASGQWDAQLGGAIGEAGVGALGNLQAQQTAGQERVDKFNQEQRKSAMGLAELDVETQRASRDPKNIVWTDKGALNTYTGEYVRTPEGDAAKPGLTPGGHNRGFASTAEASQLIGSGVPEDIANQAAAGNAPLPATIRSRTLEALERRDSFDQVKVPGVTDPVMIKDLTKAHKKAIVDQAVEIVWGQGANAPGPQNSRRPNQRARPYN